MKNKIIVFLKIIRRFLGKIKRKFIKMYKFFVLKKIKNNQLNKPYKVGFIVQLFAIWDKQIDIYEEMLKRKDIKVFMFVVPDYDFKNDKILDTYENNKFIEKYKDAIKVLDNQGNWLNIKEYNLDYIFYPRPGDDYLPKQYRSNVVSNYCRCCYIPYGLTGSDNFDDTNAPFFDNIYCLFMDSDYQKKLIESRYPISCKYSVKQVFSLGYPVLARFLNYPRMKEIKTITWTPRWSMDSIKGGSNFLKYYNNFLKLIENKKYNYIFRPHPLMFGELTKKGYIDEKFKTIFLKKLIENNVLFDINSSIEDVFEKTDLLITDFSSIIPQFFITTRPIIYCMSGIPLNEDYLEIMKYSYTANNWEDVLKSIELIEKNKGMNIRNKIEFINKKYSTCKNSAKLIVDKIEKGI